MDSLSTRSCFLIFCIVVMCLTLRILDSSYLHTDSVSSSNLKDITINVNVLQNNTNISKVRTETRDGKLEVVFDVQATFQISQGIKDLNISEIKTAINHTAVLWTTQEEKNGTTVIKNQRSTPLLTKYLISETVKTFPLTAGDYPYIINSRQVCQKESDILFLVLVHTATEHFRRRQCFRETWANVTLYQNYKMRIVFLLGLPKNESLKAQIDEESSQHGDIVQGDFIDDYHNLTHKGVMGLRWVTENCRQAKFIVKVDDDVFVNTVLLIGNLLGKNWNASRRIMGPVLNSPWIWRWGKWGVERDQFVNMTQYPFPYSRGFFVILTNDIIEELYEAAKATQFFWIDDIYLFGILPDKVGNVTFDPLSDINDNEQAAVECYASTEKNCNLLAAYAYSDRVMSKMWRWALWQNTELAMKYLTYKR